MARDQLAPKMAEAEKAKPGFDVELKAMAKSLGADVKLASVKGGTRLLEKRLLENQGDPDEMRDLVPDLVCGSIVVDSLAEVPAALDRLKADFDVTRIKDRFAKPLLSGHSDILVNVRLRGGLEAEVQIHIPEMIAGKNIAHNIYDAERKLPGNHPQKQDLLDLQSKIYGAAREANDLRTAPGSSPDSIQARKAAGDSTSAMSRRNVSGQGAEGRDGSPGKNRMADVSGETTMGRYSESGNLDPAGTAEKSISNTSKSIGSTKSNPTDFSVRDPRTKTPELKKWFGESKVVNSQGKPLVAHHGTPDGRFVNEDGVFTTMGDRMPKFGATPESRRAADDERGLYSTDSLSAACV